MIYLLAALAVYLVVSLTVTTLAVINDRVLEGLSELEGWPMRGVLLLVSPWAWAVEAWEGRGWAYLKGASKAFIKGGRVDR